MTKTSDRVVCTGDEWNEYLRQKAENAKLREALERAEDGLREGLGAALHHGSAREKDRCEKCYEAAGIINESLDAVLAATADQEGSG